MIGLQDVIKLWEVDSKISPTNLGEESLRTPNLHSKYMALLSECRLAIRKYESKYLNMRKLKYSYYRGEMTAEELYVNGWKQWQGNKPLKSEMDEFLSTDTDLITLQDKVEYFKVVANHLEQIIRSLNSRTWDIKTAVEWKKFTEGN